MLKKLVIFTHFFLFVAAVSRPTIYSAEPAFETLPLGSFPFYGGLIGIPETDYRSTILPGFLERARANQDLAADVYGEQTFLETLPNLKQFLSGHPGYWPELVGRLGDKKFARLAGFDIWYLPDGNRYVVGEENGANVGGTEFMARGSAMLRTAPEKYGAIPHNTDIFDRFASHLRSLASSFYGRQGPFTIVVADEASANSTPIRVADGKLITPPFAVGSEPIEFLRQEFQKIGVHWVSLVDDRGQLFVKNGVLHFKKSPQEGETKVDVLWTLADIESMDPMHTPQQRRNVDAHKEELNETALLVGIPGLIESWVEGKFLWANNPTSTLTRSKLWPILVDELIKQRTGRAPILPYQDTKLTMKADGSYEPAAISEASKDPRKFVFKKAIGDGGKQVWIGSSDFPSEASVREFITSTFEPWAKANPQSVIIQPEVALGRIELPDGSLRITDTRQIALISGYGDTFEATPNRDIFFRIGPVGANKGNISSGGMIGLAVPASVERPIVLPPRPFVGVSEVFHSHEVTELERDRLLEDGQIRALVEAYLIRDLYFNPEKIFKEFPALEPIVKNSIYYQPHYFQNREARFPSYHLSGPDAMQKADGSYAILEHNTTNVGGLIRLWRLGSTGAKLAYSALFEDLRKTLGKADPHIVYLLENTNLGTPWGEVQKQFKEDFGVELASADDVEKQRLRVGEDLRLRDYAGGKARIVDAFVSHFEPDFLDPAQIPNEKLLRIMAADELAERRRHSIPNINRAVGLLRVNEPGQDIVCSKAMLPFIPALTQYYLGRGEAVSIQPSLSFINPNGALNQEVWDRVRSNPTAYVAKNGEVTGNAGGVAIFRTLGDYERGLVFGAIQAHPEHFMVQELATPRKNPLGFHTEVRAFTFVKIDLTDPNVPPVIVSQSGELYGRGAEGNQMANLLPSKEAQAAGVRPGFRVPIKVIQCTEALKGLAFEDNGGI